MPHTLYAAGHSRRHSSGTNSLASSVHTLKHPDTSSTADSILTGQSGALNSSSDTPPEASSKGEPHPSAGGHVQMSPGATQAPATHHRRHSSFSRPLSYESRARQRTPSPLKRRGTDAWSPRSRQPQIPPASTMPSTLPEQQDIPDLPDFNSRYAYGYHAEGQSHAVSTNAPAIRTAAKLVSPPASPEQTHRRATSSTSRSAHGQYGQQSNGSNDANASPGRKKSRREKEKKSKLANALRMANNAVLLDNDRDYEAAIEAYEEACHLLGEVMDNSSSDDDRRKLTAIQETYSHRVLELQQLQHGDDDDGSHNHGTDHIRASLDENFDLDEPVIIETATSTHILDTEGSQTLSASQIAGNAFAKKPVLAAPVPMPMPLSLKRSAQDEAMAHAASPDRPAPQPTNQPKTAFAWLDGATDRKKSPGSSPNHSISSLEGVKRKHLRQVTDDTEAEFDAALDAAVEAAYDDGLEPYKLEELEGQHRRLSARLSTIRNPYQTEEDERLLAERQAKIRAVRAKIEDRRRNLYGQTELPPSAESDEEERILSDFTSNVSAADRPTQSTAPAPRKSDSSGFSGRTGTWGSSVGSSMTTAGTTLSTVDETSPTGTHRKQKSLPMPPPAPPPTGALPTVPAPASNKPPGLRLQNMSLQYTPQLGPPPLSPTILERRVSGNKAAALTIDTPTTEKRPFFDGPAAHPGRSESSESLVPPKTAPGAVNTTYLGTDPGKSASGDANKNWAISSPFPSPLPSTSFQQTFEQRPATGGSPLTPALPSAFSYDSSTQGDSPQRNFAFGAPTLQRNASTLSLSKGLSPGGDNQSDISPATPMSFAFSNSLSAFGGRMAPMNTPAHPQTFRQELPPMDNRTRLFDNDIHSPTVPGSPNPEARNPPKPLEPCPESSLLRPFWLMRCFYQTLAHPRGGYISTKLFVPRDVWKTKNVKLKGLEEKISNCDLLTAALLKLAAVDTYDADAILEEMQAFENVLDQAQTNLSKKLGNEVGVHNISMLFKDAPEFTASTSAEGNGRAGKGDGHAGPGQTKSGSSKDKNTGSKSYMSSWRKLRNKSSAAGLASNYGAGRESAAGLLTMESVPMTTTSTVVRGLWKHQSYPDVKAEGPNAGYMGSLTRLCDAVQILDHIARQVEDPGLRHSSPTHVGLELCARHAAEFFGFYICRFILQDIIMLADKFVKRASEWVLT